MVVKIRLARFGRRNSPFYNIVVAHARYAAPAHPLLRESGSLARFEQKKKTSC